jgi:hypothetical protein
MLLKARLLTWGRAFEGVASRPVKLDDAFGNLALRSLRGLTRPRGDVKLVLLLKV